MNSDRVSRLANLLDQEGVDAFLAWDPVTTGYLFDSHEHAGERFMIIAVKAGEPTWMICPALSVDQAKRAGIERIQGWRDGEDPLALFDELAGDWDLRTGILAVDNQMPAHLLLTLQDALPAALFREGQSLLSRLMRKKDEYELAELRKVAVMTDDAWDEILPTIRAGETERQLAQRLDEAMRRRGGRTDFCIVAAGANAAEPHHLSDDSVLSEGDSVVIDFGCSLPSGYRSDITRTVCIGTPSDQLSKVYGTVYDAHMAGRRAAKVGATGEEVDQAARQLIEEAGYGDYFVHRTGHGLGMRGHEEPYIVRGNIEALQENEVFSIEPGIYIPGSLGVRIENIVVAKESGSESLNREPSPSILSV